MKKALSLMTGAALMATLLAGCGAASASSTPSSTAQSAASSAGEAAGSFDDVDAEVTLTMSHQMAAEHSINKTAEEFARLVQEKSEGKMAVEVYPSATLGTETENLQALTNGTLDCAVIACEFYANYVDEAGIFCLPFMYTDYQDCYDKLHGEAGETVATMILDNTNVRVLDYYVLPFRQIFTVDREIKTVDDMKGLVIRIPDSNTYKTTFTQLGAAPTAVSWGETYTALDTGVVAAVENIPESIMSASMQEVCKYVNVTNHLIAPTTISISDQVYSGLTAEQQAIVDEAAKEACEFGMEQTVSGSEANFDALAGAGLTVVDTDVATLEGAIDYAAYDCAKSEAGSAILTAMGK